MSKLFAITAVLLITCFAFTAKGRADVTLKNGEWLQGHVVSSTDDNITFMVTDEDDPRIIGKDALTPTSWYLSRSETVHDARERLALATFCIDNKLYKQAQDELILAREQDPSLEEQAQVEWDRCFEEGAKDALKLAENAMTRRRYDAAEKWVSLILTKAPESSSAARAQEILDELDGFQESNPTVAGVMKLTEQDIEADPRYKSMTRHVDAGHKANKAGLREKSMSAAQRNYEAAVKHFKEAINIIDKFLATEDPATLPNGGERGRELRSELVDETVEVYANWAGLLAVRGSYNNALQVANEAIAFAPDSARAKELRSHVETLSAQSGRLGRWRR